MSKAIIHRKSRTPRRFGQARQEPWNADHDHQRREVGNQRWGFDHQKL